ncbi:MAG: phosphatase PAP2 family protein [Euryarchaeota archaeon]|nr:phosphatase PAP2 family protein [Euryarchaeota archaeon]
MGIEEDIIVLFNQGLANPVLDGLAVFLNYAGFPFTYYAAAGILYWRGHKRLALLLALSLVLADLSTVAMKFMVNRPRPPDIMDVRLVAPTDGLPSFPSGHAVRAFAFATILALEKVDRKWVIGAAAFATVISLSRIYAGAHYPTDVIGGAIWGVVCAWVSLKYAKTDAGARLIARFSRSSAATPQG